MLDLIALAIAPPLLRAQALEVVETIFLIKMPATHACHCGQAQRLVQDVRQLVGRGDSDQFHGAILDHFVGEVLPNVNVLGTLPSTDDVASPLEACSVVLVHRKSGRVSKAHAFGEVAKVDQPRSRH